MNKIGSGRRPGYIKKTIVEDCGRLRMKAIRPHLQPGFSGSIPLYVKGDNYGMLDYLVVGSGEIPTAVHLTHAIEDELTGASADHDYLVTLTTTLTMRGSPRYWFMCPIKVNGKPCGRRVEVLYLPPGKMNFGCQQCHNLTYRSSQTGVSIVREYKLVTSAQYPFLTRAEVARMVNCYLDGEQTPARIDKKIWQHAQADHRKILPDPYAGYLTATELCERSELRPADLERLASVRLLLPDHEGRYRPKLVGWAIKLSYLLAEGWTLTEIRAWAKGRWATPNPRAWPPRRDDWAEYERKVEDEL